MKGLFISGRWYFTQGRKDRQAIPLDPDLVNFACLVENLGRWAANSGSPAVGFADVCRKIKDDMRMSS